MPNVSIAVSAQDNFSSAIKTMSQVTKGFSKNAEDMQKKLNMLNKNKISLKVDTDKAKSELATLEKQFKKTGSEADGLKMQLANENYENLRRNLALVTKGTRDVEKAMVSAGNAKSKFDNTAGAGGKNIFGNLAQNIAIAGIGKMVGDLLLNGSKQMVGSYLGDEGGSLLGNMLSGAISGASLGIMTGNPIVAGITAAGGALIGTMNGVSQNQQKRDDAFKGVMQSEYERVTAKQDSDVAAGSSLAAGREIDNIAFSKLYGSKDVGEKQLEWVKDTANATPFLYEDLKSLNKTLATYNYSPEESKTRLMQIGDTGATLGMNTQDMSMVATGLGRMKSTGKTTMEYMNLLIERGIDATGYLAEAYGKSKGEITEAISRGQINGSEAADIIANLMGRDNEGAMADMSKTFGGLSSTVQGLEQEMQAALGDGYNEERKHGLEKQIAWLSGESGQQMQEANKLIGEYQASLKNEQETILQEYQAAALQRIEEGGLTGADAGRVLMEAQVAAENEYRNGEGYQLQLQSQTTMLDNLRMDLTEGWENFGYSMGQQFTLGIERGKADLWKKLHPNNADALSIPSRFTENKEAVPHELTYQDFGFDKEAGYVLPNRMPGYAFGLNFVPFDNFPAMLHHGERVLTASEARSAAAPASSVTVSGNFYVREEADIDRVAAALVQKLQKARLSYAP